MTRSRTTDGGVGGTPLAAAAGVIYATREMLVDGMAIIRETVRRKPILLVGAFLLSAFVAAALRPGRRRR